MASAISQERTAYTTWVPLKEIFASCRIPRHEANNGSTMGRITAPTTKPILNQSLSVSNLFTVKTFQYNDCAEPMPSVSVQRARSRIAAFKQLARHGSGIPLFELFASHISREPEERN